MGEANRDGVAEILLSIRRNPAKFAPKFSEFSDSEHLDLNLGLSLGGFYSQIAKEKPLIRTSSLNIDLALGENEGGRGGFLSLERSASLPTEAEQEMRKAKEIQALKRMEVKRRLLEKQRNNRGGCSDQEGKLSNLPFEKLKFNAWSATNPGIQGKWGRVLESVQGRLKPKHSVGICSRETQAQAYCVHRNTFPKLAKTTKNSIG